MILSWLQLFLPMAIWAPSMISAQWIEGECRVDLQCEAMYRPGSKCLEGGIWSNPYVAGCLNNFHTYQNHEIGSTNIPEISFPKRTCNSKDDTTKHCKSSILDYSEVRVHNGDWESPIFYAWIIQVFLSEFLQVPTTVGLGEDSAQTSFYAAEMPMT